uniref:leucine-rich repeat domain-containing protein n=1 Tax=uncultured Microscilla sp. TaxID=432653 RepID=UPI00260CE570
MKKYIGLVSFLLLFTLTSCAQNKQNAKKLLSMKALEKMEALAPEKALESPEEAIKLDLTGGVGNQHIKNLGQFKNLQYLSLESCGLNKIPDEVFEMPHLQWLNIRENKLDEIPKAIAKLTELRKLEIGGNSFTELPAEFRKLSKLEYLGLTNSQVKSYPKEFGQLKKLQELVLQNAQVTTLPSQFGELSSLKKIFLNFNPDIDSQQAWDVLAQLPNLEEVVFYGSNVKSLPLKKEGFSKVKKLHLGGDKLDLKQVLTTLGVLPSLEFLYLDQVTSIPSEVSKLTKLKTLILFMDKSSEEEQEKIFINSKNVTSLELLRIRGRYFSVLPKQVGELKQLKTLYIQGQLTTVPEEIKKLKNLKLLNLEMNKFPPEEKARIKKLLPNTEIKF